MTKQMKNCRDVKDSSILATQTERNTVNNQNHIEEWRDILEYEGEYQVSNFGRIKSFKKKLTPHVLCQQKSQIGYYVVGLYKNRQRKVHFAHRLVAKEFILNPENKPDVDHIDGDKQNNNLSNLRKRLQITQGFGVEPET